MIRYISYRPLSIHQSILDTEFDDDAAHTDALVASYIPQWHTTPVQEARQ